MAAPTLLCAKDPTTPTGAEQSYLFYTESTAPDGSVTSQIVWRGTKTMLNTVIANAAKQTADAQAKLTLVAALPA